MCNELLLYVKVNIRVMVNVYYNHVMLCVIQSALNTTKKDFEEVAQERDQFQAKLRGKEVRKLPLQICILSFCLSSLCLYVRILSLYQCTSMCSLPMPIL